MNDTQLINRIAQRASELYDRLSDVKVQPAFIASELWIVHSQIVRLRLQELYDADDMNFAHDIGGIHRHLNIGARPHPKLEDGFTPRFAKV